MKKMKKEEDAEQDEINHRKVEKSLKGSIHYLIN